MLCHSPSANPSLFLHFLFYDLLSVPTIGIERSFLKARTSYFLLYPRLLEHTAGVQQLFAEGMNERILHHVLGTVQSTVHTLLLLIANNYMR